MSESTKFVQFISKLVELTQRGEIGWSTAGPIDEVSSTSFEATVNGQILRIYQRRAETTNTNRNLLALSVTVAPTVIMDVLDGGGRATFTFKGITGLNDLYNAASRSASKVDELIDAVLGRPDNPFE